MKSDVEIIDKLIRDTQSGHLKWGVDKEKDCFSATIRTAKANDNNTMIDIAFTMGDNYDGGMSLINYFMYIDIYMKKNNKKEIFVTRIKSNQVNIQDLMTIVSDVAIKNGLQEPNILQNKDEVLNVGLLIPNRWYLCKMNFGSDPKNLLFKKGEYYKLINVDKEDKVINMLVDTKIVKKFPFNYDKFQIYFNSLEFKERTYIKE